MVVFDVDILSLIGELNNLLERYKEIYGLRDKIKLFGLQEELEELNEVLTNIRCAIKVICEKIKGA